MKFSYNWLQSFFKARLPKPEKLAELLTMHSFETTCQKPAPYPPPFSQKGRGGAGSKVNSQESILDIDVLPNRGPDCFSHFGIARECSALLNYELGITNYELKEDKRLKAKDFISVEVKDKSACPRYTARVITDVRVGPSPKWIRERLEVCGLRPINNIVDIANYVMLEVGQPLHAFDGEKIADKKIIVRFAKEKEKITTLDNEDYNLDKEILIIADTKRPIGIAGIKGEKFSGIDKKTKIVVLESANFNPQVIRKGSKKIGLKTDASLRFEHGIDPNLTEIAINRAAYLIQKIAHPQGGYPRVCQDLIDFYPKKVFPKKIKLDLDYVENLLGIKIPEKEIKNILEKLGLKIEPRTKLKNQFSQSGLRQVSLVRGKILNVVVPTFRLDISLPEDLIEEIGRIYGYDKIRPILPAATIIPPHLNEEIIYENKIKDILVASGLSEVYNYSFVDKSLIEEKLVEIENPISQDQKYLRSSLIPNLLKNVKDNLRYFNQVRIFEIGKVYQELGITEKKMIAGVIFSHQPSTISSQLFYELKGVVDLLLNKLGISDLWYDDQMSDVRCPRTTPPFSQKGRGVRGKQISDVFHPLRRAQIKVSNQSIGWLGKIDQKILSSLEIKAPVVAFEIDFENLMKLAQEERIYQPPSKYPAIIRDIAVLVEKGDKTEEVLNVIETSGGKLVSDIDLFDIYEGEEIPEDKKSLAFHIIYQSDKRTLTDKEVNKIQKKIIRALEERGWEVRK